MALRRSIDVIRAADLRADRCFQGLQPMTAAGGRKNDYPGECRAFPQGTPRTSKCVAPASRSDAGCHPGDLGSLGCSVTRCFPLEELPTTGECGAASTAVYRASTGATRHTGASRAIDEGSGRSCAARGQRTSQARALAASATSKGPLNGSIWDGITAPGAVRFRT